MMLETSPDLAPALVGILFFLALFLGVGGSVE
jgi:hypothetical protein